MTTRIKGKIKHPFFEFDVDLRVVEDDDSDPIPQPEPVPTPPPVPEPMPSTVKTANPASITQMISTLQAGDTLLLEDGIYSSTQVVGITGSSDKPITIRSKVPYRAIFKTPEVGLWVFNSSWIVVEGVRAENCGIGLYMGSPQAVGATENIIFRDCQAINSNMWGMAANGNARCKAKKLRFESCKIQTVRPDDKTNGHGLKFASWEEAQHSEDAIVINCDISDAYYHGVQCSTGWKNITIVNSRIYDNGLIEGDYRGGIRIGNEVGGVIRGNILTNNRRGILLEQRATDILVEKNQISKSQTGVVITDGINITVGENTFENNKEGLYLARTSQAIILKNTFVGTGNNLVKSGDAPGLPGLVVKENINLME